MSFLDLLTNEEIPLDEEGFMEDDFGMDADDAADEEDDDALDDQSNIPDSISRLMEQEARTVNDKTGAPLSSFRILNEEEDQDDQETYENEEEDMKALEDDLENTIARGTKKRKRGRKPKARENPRVKHLMGQVNVAYVNRRFDDAFKMLHEVIQIDFKFAPAWRLLAVIHDEMGDPVKALQANFLAAHLTPKDSELWMRLAMASKAMNHIEDAIYCLNKAIAADPDDLNAWYERATLYAQQNRLQKAIDGFSTILRLRPLHMLVIKDLSKIYLSLKDAPRAISLFESALDADLKSPLSPPQTPVDSDEDETMVAELSLKPKERILRVGYDEVHMLAELYFEMKDYEKAFNAIRCVVLRVHGYDETEEDEDAFDETLLEFSGVPVELRAKLGICRLWMNDMAKAQFDVSEFPDHYYDVADAYSDRRMFESALDVLNIIERSEVPTPSKTWKKMAYCFQQLGHLESAAELYAAVVEDDAEDIESRFQLADVYNAMGDHELAENLVNEAQELSVAATQEIHSRATNVTVTVPHFVKPQAESSIKKAAASDDKVIAAAEEAQRARENRSSWAKMKILANLLDDPMKRADFSRTARAMISEFQSTKVFYPADRSKVFTGFNNRRRRWSPGPEGEREFGSLEIEKLQFSGLTFKDWFMAFCEYGKALSLEGKHEDAFNVLKSAFEANVFYHDEVKKQKLKMQMMAAAVHGRDFGKAIETIRWFCQHYPESQDPYRLYVAVVSRGGTDASTIFASQVGQKYLNRQIKGLEKGLQENSALFTLYAHILMSARSYSVAISYYARAFKQNPQDPILNMCLGIAYLHMAMQRRVKNRQLRIVQGFTFLFRYFELQKGCMEACYNLGRAFHQVGILDYAVEYYQKVLDGPQDHVSGNLKREAAYNLSLIYAASGSGSVAQLFDFDMLASRKESTTSKALSSSAPNLPCLIMQDTVLFSGPIYSYSVSNPTLRPAVRPDRAFEQDLRKRFGKQGSIERFLRLNNVKGRFGMQGKRNNVKLEITRSNITETILNEDGSSGAAIAVMKTANVGFALVNVSKTGTCRFTLREGSDNDALRKNVERLYEVGSRAQLSLWYTHFQQAKTLSADPKRWSSATMWEDYADAFRCGSPCSMADSERSGAKSYRSMLTMSKASWYRRAMPADDSQDAEDGVESQEASNSSELNKHPSLRTTAEDMTTSNTISRSESLETVSAVAEPAEPPEIIVSPPLESIHSNHQDTSSNILSDVSQLETKESEIVQAYDFASERGEASGSSFISSFYRDGPGGSKATASSLPSATSLSTIHTSPPATPPPEMEPENLPARISGAISSLNGMLVKTRNMQQCAIHILGEDQRGIESLKRLKEMADRLMKGLRDLGSLHLNQ
ncbi:transcription factor TFIIIC subunit tfc4 [Phlyctochytrium planicorne]|nr:transcription factor TFIIIC subunit tfc4 [Phlyctochytrium planicorne]